MDTNVSIYFLTLIYVYYLFVDFFKKKSIVMSCQMNVKNVMLCIARWPRSVSTAVVRLGH